MTQLAFQLTSAAPSQSDLILERLQEARGEWVPMPELVKCSGSYNVHSRISDLRKRGHDIAQRNERGPERATLSFYRLLA